MGNHAGKAFAVSSAPVADVDLDQTGYEALTFVTVADVGTYPEYGNNPPVAEYKTKKGVKKAKGIPDFGGGDLEMVRIPADAGQLLLRGYGNTASQYAYRITHLDGKIVYLRGVISGPTTPDGEDFVIEKYTLGFNQAPVIVEAA